MLNLECVITENTEKFHQLQSQLRQMWQNNDIFAQNDCDILVVPSFSMDQEVGQKVAGFLHYEERLLFSLIRLRNPQTRLIYVTAEPLSPLIVDYYLQLLPGIPLSHARDRLLLFSAEDHSFKPLTQKILDRPRLLKRLAQYLRPGKSYMVCYNSTVLEQELSIKLGIPLLASSPSLLYWGTKSGSREIFADCELPYPDGSLQTFHLKDLLEAAAQLWERQPQLKRMLIKLNEGFSGEGNALLDLRPLQHLAPPQGSHEERIKAITDSLESLRFQAQDETWATFSSRLRDLGGIVEAFIEGEEKRSPSVQGYITPRGDVEIISTHDQILGGLDGQVYLGCTFPADDAYRLGIQELALKVGKSLATKGAMESFGVDFLAVKQENGNWDLQAIEINLRKGGTTHPFMTLKLLTNGKYDLNSGLFYSAEAQEKYYIATDNLQKPQYRGLLPYDLMEIIAHNNLHYDSSTKTGNVFHLIGALSEFGKFGVTSIGNSREQAEAIYNNVQEILDRETTD